MQTVCTSLQTYNHTNTSSLNFLQAGWSLLPMNVKLAPSWLSFWQRTRGDEWHISEGLPVTTDRALLNSSWQRQICCVTRWKFSDGSRIGQSRLRPAAVASERYLRRGSTVSCGNSSSSSNSNSNSNCNSSVRCYLPSLQCLHNKQSNHSANYRSSDTSANSSAAKFLLIQLSPFWLFSLQNSNTFKILLPGLFKHTMTVPFPAVASALAPATCLFPYQV